MFSTNLVTDAFSFLSWFSCTCLHRYIIYVKEGVYEETVIVEKKMENVVMYGDGSMKTIVTGSKNFIDGVRTFQTATFGMSKC